MYRRIIVNNFNNPLSITVNFYLYISLWESAVPATCSNIAISTTIVCTAKVSI